MFLRTSRKLCPLPSKQIEAVNTCSAANCHSRRSGTSLQQCSLEIALNECLQKHRAQNGGHEKQHLLRMLEPEAKFAGIVAPFAFANVAVPHAAARQKRQIPRRQHDCERSADDELFPVSRIHSIQNRAYDSAGDPYREKDFDRV